jgi:hypothetical protein
MILNEDNFPLYAAKHYENFSCESTEEFEKDMAIFKYLKKLFYVYENKDDLRERLILNHLIVLYNIFEARACTKMLILKLKGYHPYLFPFLKFLDYLPDNVTGIYNDQYILKVNSVKFDEFIIEKLKMIKHS